MSVLRVVFANQNPLMAFHMLNGGGESIPYKTMEAFLEYLDVYEAIEVQSRKDAEEAAKAGRK